MKYERYLSENWAPFFHLSGYFTLTHEELERVFDDINQNYYNLKTEMDFRFGSEVDYLNSATSQIRTTLENSNHHRDVLLSFGECFAIYQILKETKSEWRSFFLDGAIYQLEKMVNRGLTTIFENLTKEDAKRYRATLTGMRLVDSVLELNLVAEGRSVRDLEKIPKHKRQPEALSKYIISQTEKKQSVAKNATSKLIRRSK